MEVLTRPALDNLASTRRTKLGVVFTLLETMREGTRPPVLGEARHNVHGDRKLDVRDIVTVIDTI